MVLIIFQLECCGVDNLTDWFYIPAWPDKANVPSSCCVNQSFGCGEANSDAAWYTRVSTPSHVTVLWILSEFRNIWLSFRRKSAQNSLIRHEAMLKKVFGLLLLSGR